MSIDIPVQYIDYLLEFLDFVTWFLVMGLSYVGSNLLASISNELSVTTSKNESHTLSIFELEENGSSNIRKIKNITS